MIKKLKMKVFWILMISISTIVLGVIILFAIVNYNSMISAATSMFDRFDDFSRMPNSEKIDKNVNDNEIGIDLSKIYTYMLDNGKIIDNIGGKNQEIEKYVYKIYEKNKKYKHFHLSNMLILFLYFNFQLFIYIIINYF